MHFQMLGAKHSLSLSWLPAFLVLATIDLYHLGFILPKVKSFRRMYLRANSNLEVFIGNFPIPIQVKFIKQKFKLLIRVVKSPVLEVKSQFVWLNSARFVNVEIHECLSQSFPLVLYFIKHCFLKILVYEQLRGYFFGIAQICLVLF